MIDKKLEEKFLGKRIEITHPDGYVSRGYKIEGICEFIGENLLLPSWGLIVILDRTPFSNVDLKTVKIIK